MIYHIVSLVKKWKVISILGNEINGKIMEDKLKVAYFQQDIVWENTKANLEKIVKVLNSLDSGTDLFILPEMFHAGFTMDPGKIAEKMSGEVVSWLKNNAQKHNVTIIGSVIIAENGKYFNRLFVAAPDKDIEYYDKRHLFSIGGENDKYQKGEKRLITKVKNWRIMPLICYDLRFPVWSRNRNDYDLLIYIANWPESRREVWNTLLKARALENQCYVIGVNRTGADPENSYAGDSMVIDAKGKIISCTEEKAEELRTIEIDLSELKSFRKRFPVWKDSDDFKIMIR